MTDITLKIDKIIHAPIEKVFDAWLNPTILAKFMIPMPDMPTPDVENDAREGGTFTIIMHVGKDNLPHTGEYLEIKRPQKLVFTWVSHRSVDGSVVTLNFTKIDDNRTHVALSHVKFVDEEARKDHEAGWGHILDTLNELMEGTR